MRPTSLKDIPQDDFEWILVAELETLRKGERRLERLYSKMGTKPHLREQFLNQLAEIRQRADRLDAVLNPFSTIERMPSHSINYQPAA